MLTIRGNVKIFTIKRFQGTFVITRVEAEFNSYFSLALDLE